MIRYSIKQMLRSRLKTVLLLLLLTGSACLLAVGIDLWDMNHRTMKEFEEIFTTIGTVQQKKYDMGLRAVWDEVLGKNIYYQNYEYGDMIRDDRLIFDEAEYLIEPIQRPYFGADMGYVPDYPSFDGQMEEHYFTAEFVPLENYDGTKPVTLEIVKSYAEGYQAGDQISFFHHEDIRLEAGKRYIASLTFYTDVNGDENYEFCLGAGLYTTQYNRDGSERKAAHEEVLLSEITDGFYESETGRCWLEQSKAVQKFQDILPVTPVEDTKLIMAFYEQRAYVTEGRDISPDEYRNGENVCLIPQYLAKQLGWKVGDKIRLPLFYASYEETPALNFGINGGGFGFVLLNADGKCYDVFDDQAYEVVGIYDLASNPAGEYALSPIEVFIPYNAVKGSWNNNIVSIGPMKAGNTSFEIENGSIDEFLEPWNQQDFAKELEVTFYDKGYSEFESSIQSRKIMSYIFLVSGFLLSLTILLFFCNLFITGQREKITIERIMGFSRKESVVSALTGLLLVTTGGIISGSAAGWILVKELVMQFKSTITYDALYSITMVHSDGNNTYEMISGNFSVIFITIGVLLAATVVISGFYMRRILKDEPLVMLGKIEE